MLNVQTAMLVHLGKENDGTGIMVGRPKLDDTKAACNMIKRMRKQNKENLKKSVTVPLHIGEIRIGCILVIAYNPSTGYVGKAHALKCKRAVVYPTVHQKLRCVNRHTLELLEKERECTRKRQKKEKEEKEKKKEKKNIIVSN